MALTKDGVEEVWKLFFNFRQIKENFTKEITFLEKSLTKRGKKPFFLEKINLYERKSFRKNNVF